MTLSPVEKKVLAFANAMREVDTLDTLDGVDQTRYIATLYELWGAGFLSPSVLEDRTMFTITYLGIDALEKSK
jgi:hypothetical protein